MAKLNGINNVDTKQMEEMRAQVVEQELSARSWKAYYEKMYYSIESEKLEPLYKEYKDRLAKRLEEEKKQFEEFMSTMKQNVDGINKGDTLGTLNVSLPEEDTTETPVIKMN